MNERTTDTVCGECGTPIFGESSNGASKHRKPCPKCGSTARTFSVLLSVTATATATVEAEVISYPETLLSIAGSLIAEGLHSISVVVSHMACEVATERCLSDAFANKGIEYLEDAVSKLLSSYNLGNDRVLKLYTSLTGDDQINDPQPFWQKFKESSERRNRIIHNGLIVGQPEAEESLQAACNLVSRLKAVADH